MCVCERERGCERERERVCVCERERERESERQTLCGCGWGGGCWRRGKGFKDPDKASGRVCPSRFILSKTCKGPGQSSFPPTSRHRQPPLAETAIVAELSLVAVTEVVTRHSVPSVYPPRPP